MKNFDDKKFIEKIKENYLKYQPTYKLDEFPSLPPNDDANEKFIEGIIKEKMKKKKKEFEGKGNN